MDIQQLVNLLASHRTIGSAPRQELAWIAEHGSYRHLDPGDIITSPSRAVDDLYILLTGRIAIYMNRGSGLKRMMEWTGGDVTGLLPYSRLVTPPGDTIVEDPTDAVTISRGALPDLIRNCYEVTSILVHVMTDRARRFTSSDLRDEKMISLGKLAAGFAHEINNPSSAALRDSKSLVGALAATQEASQDLWAIGLSETQRAHLETLWNVCRITQDSPPMSGLVLSDKEDAIASWLRELALDEALAADLAKTPSTLDDLKNLARVLDGAALGPALRWIAASSSACSLALNIERATSRIHQLVAVAKGFTHMDRAPILEPVEISSGLADTLALLAGKAHTKSVVMTLNVERDLPQVKGYAVELNQVWMNLIDNAIDASPEKGKVSVSAMLEGWEVVVAVRDDGPGIPEEIRENIFDPFFTTKPVGEGSGLGLDIVNRIVRWHNGVITVDSRPGQTEFRVRLPVAGPG